MGFSLSSSSSDKKGVHTASVFESTMKHSVQIVALVALIALGVCGYFVFHYFSAMSAYRAQQSEVLPDRKSHYTNAPSFSVDGINSTTAYSLLESYAALNKKQEDSKEQLRSFRQPFMSFLRYVYLPSLNVWKNPFTDEIDVALMGERFLENNPYTDIALINQWTDFFKDMGSGIYNTIDSIVVNDIVEEGDFFYIPIEVAFTAPTRRSFLFLLNKLSMTSDRDNIALMNELFYYVWSSLGNVDDLDDVLIASLGKKHVAAFDALVLDDKIAYVLMKWKDGEIESLPFITNDLLQSIVRNASGCSATDTRDKCQFLFREKFRSIPEIAYGLGYKNVSANDLFYVLNTIPPLLVIDNFSFDEGTGDGLTADRTYGGSVSLRVYGHGIKSGDVHAIASTLGALCGGESINPSYAMSLIQKKIDSHDGSSILGIQRFKDLTELRSIVESIAGSYDGLTPYQKTIKTFEIYRMLVDMQLCD